MFKASKSICFSLIVLAIKIDFTFCSIYSGKFQLKSEKQMDSILEQIKQKNILNYGDKCDPMVEQGREVIQRTFIKMARIDSSEIELRKKVITEIQILLNLAPADFCNEDEFLECNKQTKKCDCIVQSGIEIKLRTRRQNNKCVSIKRSICAPKDVQDLQQNQASQYGFPILNIPMTCEKGTECFVSANGLKVHCNFEYVALLVLKENLEGLKTIVGSIGSVNTGSIGFGSKQIISKMIEKTNRICSCDIPDAK